MPSTFYGMEIGVRALAANQLALDVTGQNTANVGTPGYSRQVAVFEATDPIGAPATDSGKPAQLGTGVTVSSVNQVRDQFLDARLNSATSDQGSLNTVRDILGRVETAYGEPSTTGIGSQITALFSSFSDLAAAPESEAVRSTVLNNVQALVSAFHGVNTGISQLTPEIQSRITSDVGDVNGLTAQIAALNKQIGPSIANGDHPNDLLDKRTALVAQLSGLVNVQLINSKDVKTNQPTGEIQINVGGFTVVNGDSATALPSASTTANGTVGLQAANGQTIPLLGGEVYGLIQAGGLVNGYQSDLNTLASSLANAVNAQQSAGTGLDGKTGINLIWGDTAGNIAVNPAVANNLDAIAAASTPAPPATAAPGNGDNATALAALSSQPVIGALSLDQYYNAKVAGIGADSQRFQAQADSQAKVVTQIQNQQSSVSGVNLDEELTKMLQYQRAYQAAARIINVQDDILNRIIHGLGVGATV